MTTASCTPKEPFIKLDDSGKASILNYNLPQSTCYRASVVLPIEFPATYFPSVSPPPTNFWTLAQTLSKEEWVEKLRDEIDLASNNSIFSNQNLIKKFGVRQLATSRLEEQVENGSTTLKAVAIPASIAGVPITEIAEKIKKGFKPILSESIAGKVRLSYIPVRESPKPQIVLLMKLKMCSYLGDYGAGKTLKTFSLLPGERTTISVRTWERNEDTKREASNVLDSFSESNAQELQEIIENETSITSNINSVVSKEFGGDLSVGLVIPGTNVGVDGGISGSRTSTFTDALENAVRSLTNSTSTQAMKSDSLRSIEVNTESTSSKISEFEETTVRSLENINKSRVLNFVFRQLLQEFFTITYLEDVQLAYVTGYDEHKIVSNLGGLDSFLKEVISLPANQEIVKAKILNRLCNIEDYTGTKQRFIECVEENLTSGLDCDCLPNIPLEVNCYIRKRKDITQTYNGKSVNGIILDVTHRILRTPALIVDSLLGQGEALDCYNQKLQEAAVINAELHNDQLQQAIEVINSITDPIERAKMYKKVFGDCCDVPQSGCLCSNNTPSN